MHIHVARQRPRPYALRGLSVVLAGLLALTASSARAAFVNWENPHVHPLDVTPDGTRLLAVNTTDNRLDIFVIHDGGVSHLASVPVGLDPVSVRARSNNEVWVINHISDSVSVVNLNTLHVRATLTTDDEPADIVFAGTPERAYVSCAQANTVLVFDPDDLSAAPAVINIVGEDPRALAVSADGSEVYAAIFESGNSSTVLGGGSTMAGGFPPNVVNDPAGPYGGVNPPPNDGSNFRPAQKPGNPPPPKVGLIVKKNDAGQWTDDNNGDWTDLVSGANASLSGRSPGWDIIDHDIAIIDTQTLAVIYVEHTMNMCMALAVNPGNDEVTLVGTDALNQERFEPVLAGRFLRVQFARADADTAGVLSVSDLNDHLTYTDAIPFVPIAQSERDKSIGDPRAIIWNADGSRGYIAGMGSNNVVTIDASGQRAGLKPAIDVGEGPTGMVLDESRNRLYVLNKFAASISVVDLTTETVLSETPVFDPTPAAIKIGRKHLYDTHRNSGLGHIACASCHVDARMDRLSWDLGNPAGDVKPFDQNCPGGGCQDWHPMKGPMLTQTLQDIIGKEPHHWRGDRAGLEAFAGAFASLQGDDQPLPANDMQALEDFLATIHFPPNPFRNLDNTLPTDLPLPGHFTTGRFGPAGQPLPNGDAVAGLLSYRTDGLDGGLQCVTCHTLPTGMGANLALVGLTLQPIPPGPNGEMHHALVSVDGSTNVSMKTPQLRNLYERVGFDTTQQFNTTGFGFLHDGSIDSIARFVNEPVFSISSDQETADMVAFMLAFSGSDLPTGSMSTLLEPLGPESKDTHAAVGRQTTLVDEATADAAQLALIDDMITLAQTGAVGLVAHATIGGEQRASAYVGSGLWQGDMAGLQLTSSQIRALAQPGAEITYTVVVAGTETRIGIDADEDGFFNTDERLACSDPRDASSVPGDARPLGDADRNGVIDVGDYARLAMCLAGPSVPASIDCGCFFDYDDSGAIDLSDVAAFQIAAGQ